MTTIVYRDGLMVGDTRAYSADKHPIGHKAKIARLDDGTLIGVSSTIPGGGETVIEWWKSGLTESKELPKYFSMLVVKPNGDAFYACDSSHVSGPLSAPYFAIGSGEQYAQGALAMGACAVDACRVACRLDAWTDLPLLALQHTPGARWRIER